MDAITKLVPECNLPPLEEAIATLNKRCKRLGLADIVLAKSLDHVKFKAESKAIDQDDLTSSTKWLTEAEFAKYSDKYRDSGERMAWYNVTVSGESPKLNGWEFIAVLEPMTTEDNETLNLIQCLPGKECPTAQRVRINVCDHCCVKRKRSQTFVVFNAATGEYKSVGRQCLKDFLGYHADPEALISQAELLASLSDLVGGFGEFDEGSYGSSRERSWDSEMFLSLTACRIRLVGWLSASKAFEFHRNDATKNIVLQILTPPYPLAHEEEKRIWRELVAAHVVTDADKATAKAALEWAREIPNASIEGNDYLANVNLVSRMGFITRKTAGVGASIVSTYQREVEKELKRQEFAKRPPSNHIGKIGERLKLLKVKCEKVIMNEGQFGLTGIHKLTVEGGDNHGSDLVWFASGGRVIDDGTVCVIDGTVKKHDEYNGRKQTVLTRVTALSDEYVKSQEEKAARKAARAAKKQQVA